MYAHTYTRTHRSPIHEYMHAHCVKYADQRLYAYKCLHECMCLCQKAAYTSCTPFPSALCAIMARFIVSQCTMNELQSKLFDVTSRSVLLVLLSLRYGDRGGFGVVILFPISCVLPGRQWQI